MDSKSITNQRLVGVFSILFLLMWVCQSTSNVTLVSLLRLHKFEGIQSATWYLSVCIILQAPHFMTIAHIIWKNSFITVAKCTRWPSKVRITLGILVNLLEVVCLCILMAELSPLLPDHILLLLPGFVYTIPIIVELATEKSDKKSKVELSNFYSRDDKNRCESSSVIKYVILSIIFVSPTLISAILFMWSPYKIQIVHFLILPAILLLLSVLWIPQVQLDIVSSSDKLLPERWKTSMLYATIKLLAIPLCLGVILTTHFKDLRSAYFVDFLADGFREMLRFEVYLPIILIITSGFMATFVGLIAAKVGLITSLLSITPLLSTPTAIIISMIQCLSIPGPAAELCKAHDFWVLITTLLSLLVWFVPFMMRARSSYRPTDVLLKPFDECFLHFTWTTLFLDQRIDLNYYPNGLSDQTNENPSLRQSIRLGSRVFICTTMYNESEMEMRRLLQSLYKVAESRKLRDVYIESHIFLDNGSRNGRLNENARRLVNLTDLLNKDYTLLDILTTPYGIQMILALGKYCLPFFLHFKDSEKFKAKKRWSQVMYMNYVLNYRCTLFHTNKMASKMISQHKDGGSFEGEQKAKDLKTFSFRQSKEMTANKKASTLDTGSKGYNNKIKKSYDHSNKMEAVINFELERLRVLLNARRQKYHSFDKICSCFDDCYATLIDEHTNHNPNPNAASRRSYLHQNGSPFEIAISISNILSFVHNSRCSNQCLKFNLTNNLFLPTTSEESSAEDDEPMEHSEAYTVSGESYTVSDEVQRVDGDTDGQTDNDEEDGNFTEKSSSCDNRKLSTSYEKRDFKTNYERRNLDNSAKHIWNGENGCQTSAIHHFSINDGYIKGSPLILPSISSTKDRTDTEHLEYDITSLQDESRGASESTTSSTYNYSFDLRPTPKKGESREWMFQHIDKPTQQSRQPFWSSSWPFCNSSSCSSLPSSKSLSSNIDQPEVTNDIFTITNNGSVKAEDDVIRTVPSNIQAESHFDDQTFILATDADMDFDDSSVYQLLDLCNRDKRVGGACGRTRPIGQRNNPVVWYQKFEYAKDFWMIKTSQNVIGCVMCCPGCFSLYRADAVKEVMKTYHQPTQSPFDVFIKDHGEDRWLCTLMMLNGWKLEYTPYSENSTFCPDTFLEFLKQRKRWVLSEVANLMLVFQNIRRLASKNTSFSLVYIAYILQMFLLVILSPGTTIAVLTASLDILFGFSCVYTTPLCVVGLILYTTMCSTQPIRMQSVVSFGITVLLGFTVLLISVGYVHFIAKETIMDLQDGRLEFKQYYLLLVLMVGVLYSAFIHPKELPTLIHGLTFLLSFPAMYILLPFYAVANIVDQRWGTRDQDGDDSSCHVTLSACFQQRNKINPDSQSKKDLTPKEPVQLADRIKQGSFSSLATGSTQQQAENMFWENLRTTIAGRDVNLGMDAATIAYGLKDMRNQFLVAILFLNLLWLVFLTTMYMVIPRHDNVFSFVACSIYSFSLVIQLVGLTAHKCDSFFRQFVIKTFGRNYPIWIHPQNER